MGAGWKHAGKQEKANAKGALHSKLAKEIQVAARMGGPDPDSNARLRAGIEAARKQSVTRDTIERAIKKGAGIGNEAVTYETLAYEGFGPHKVPVIVECLTDNRNRTNSEVRSVFNHGGQLGSIGSVAWMFDRVGIVEGTHKDKSLDLETVAIEIGAQNVEPLESDEVPEGMIGARFFTDPEDLDATNKAAHATGWSVTKAELGYNPKNYPDLTEEQQKEVIKWLQDIDDCEDVHRVYTAMR
jgi:YebC/PmpR family DNA-binding regulatory protein